MEHTSEIIHHLADYGTITLTWYEIAFIIVIYLSLFAALAFVIRVAVKLFNRKKS
jgi:hypothetical protein